MSLPAAFPQAPKPPPANTQTDPKVLADYLSDVYEWLKKLRAELS